MLPEWLVVQSAGLLTALGLLVLVPLSVLRTRQLPRALRFAAPLLVAAVLGIGWLASEWRGTLAENRARHLLLQRTAAVARSIDPELVKTLRFGPQDGHSAAFGRIRQQMAAYARAAGMRSLYSMAVRGQEVLFGPESLD